MDWWTYEVCQSVPAASKQALTTTTQNHGTNNIHSHIDGYTSKSTSQVLLPLYKTIYRDVQNLYHFSNVYQNLLQKLKILWLCIAGKLHKTMNIKLLHTLPLVWRDKLRQKQNGRKGDSITSIIRPPNKIKADVRSWPEKDGLSHIQLSTQS